MSNTSLGNLTVNLVAETGSYEEGMDRAQRATEKLEKAAQKQAAELDKLRNAIDPIAGQLSKVEKQQQALNKAFSENRLNADEYGKLNTKLEQTRKGLQGLGKEMKAGSMSAAQLAFATRQLPMQFTDIFVSLAAGQNPMTVMLQQGGQLKDTFGGIGPAAKAMGSYIAGLVNPYTVAAAAAGVLALAYYQGSEEADKFRDAIVLSGNAAGTSVDQLRYMADTFDSTVGTTGKAAEAFALLAASGEISGAQFDSLAEAAIKMETATGKAVGETVKEFEQLAKSPVSASEELNKKYNYLTASIYEQIKALEESGNKTGAANLAMTAYSDVVQQRSDVILENLGAIESAWEGIKKAAKGAWDSALDVGRDDSLGEQLDQAKALLEQLKTNQTPYSNIDYDAVNEQEKIVEQLSLQIKTQEALAKKDAEKAALTKEAISAQSEIQKLSAASLTNEEKKVKAVKEYLANIEKIRKANPESSFLDQSKIDKDLAAINAQYTEKSKAKKTPEYKESASDRLLDKLRQQQATLELQLGTTDKIGSAAEKLAAFEQEIADIKEKKTLTAEQKNLLANEDAIRAQHEKNVAIEKQIDLQKQVARTLELERSLKDQINREQENYNDRLEAFGKGDKALEKLKERQRIERDYQKQLEQLNDQRSRGDLSSDQYKTELELLQDSLDERVKLYEDYYARQQAMQEDWSVGASRALENYIDNAKNIAGMTEDIIGNAFAGLEDVIYDFVATGELKLGDLMRSIGQEVIQMLIRIGIQKTASFLLDKALGTSAATGFVAQVSGQAYAGMNLAAINAYASTALLNPLLAPAAAGAAVATTAPFVGSAIAAASSTLAGMAHSGIDSIPTEGTWLLDKGERVLSPRQNRDLTQFLTQKNSGGRNQPVEVSINLSAVRDEELLRMLSGRRGEIAGMVAAALADSGLTLG